MKKYIYIYLLMCLASFTSCKKVLDKEDPSAISPMIWDNEVTAKLYLNKLYLDTYPSQGLTGQGLGGNASYSDEVPGGSDYMYGRLTAASVGNYSVAYYGRIRNINIAIQETENGGMSDDAKKRTLGQALFLRAWEYWNLVNLYGGVPLVLKPLDAYKDELDVPRNKTSECIAQIVADLDKAVEYLPAKWDDSERGRVTRGAAAALKGRVLLYWASPQFNPDNDPARWKAAYVANVAAEKLLVQDQKGLYSSYKDIFITENNKEVIFARLYDYTAGIYNTWENSARPAVAGGKGTSVNPTWDLVKAYPMKNGKYISDQGSGYDENHFWMGRDPRFDATIAYNGQVWEFNGLESAGRKQWTYYYKNGNNVVSVEGTNPTTTGFYCRKAINPGVAISQTTQAGTDWIEIRFAEVMLNLAECANEVGTATSVDSAYIELVAIRQRAGIDRGAAGLKYGYGLNENLSKNELRAVIMRERQVEFAFENKRYWDLRRRNMFANDLPGTSNTKLNGTRRTGIRIVLKPSYTPSNLPSSFNLNNDFDTYFTLEKDQIKDSESAINYLQPQYNFFAIPQAMLDRSPAVLQTNTWPGGTFDPYQ